MNDLELQIRQATPQDVADVKSCARAAYSKYVDRIGKVPAPMDADFPVQISRGIVYVALTRGRFAGYVVFYSEGDHMHLENIAVVPHLSGNGIGKRLISYVEQTALEQGLKAVELYTNEAMTENLRMYPRLGYVEYERKPQAGFRRVFFRKQL